MSIILPVALVAGLGLVAGIILTAASIIMATQTNEKKEAILAALPGANCGSCGYTGCENYAAALVEGKAELTSCPPGGETTAKKLAEILGVEAGEMIKKGAFVKCRGSLDHTYIKADYQGISSCAAANMYLDGPNRCSYGCLGFGDCAADCPYGAIEIIRGLATIDLCKCIGCGICVKSCPKKIISLLPVNEGKALVRCSSKDKAAYTRNVCSAGCIACGRCVKVCPSEAISIINNLAVIDSEKCIGCGKCVEVCPVEAIGI